MYENLSLYIDGKLSPAGDGRSQDVVNPATGEVIGTLAACRARPTSTARSAPPTRASRPGARSRPSSATRSCARPPTCCASAPTTIAQLMTLEQGKPLAEAQDGDADGGRHHRLVRRGRPPRLWPRHPGARRGRAPARAEGAGRRRSPPSRRGTSRSTRWCASSRRRSPPAARSSSRRRRRRRLAGRADPRASPMPACRPAWSTSSTACRPRSPSYLIPHPVIRKISFTGSTAGRQAARGAGRPAHEARDDGARRPRAGDRVRRRRRRRGRRSMLAGSKFRNAGQVCVSPTRFLVQEGVYDRFVEQFVEHAKRSEGRRRPGRRTRRWARSPTSAASTRWRRIVDDARQHGAKVATGGKRIGNKGYFFEPTVLTDVPDDAAHHERGAVRPARADQSVQELRRRVERGEPPALRPRRLRLHALGQDRDAIAAEGRDAA